jgi:diguanylate cyclase (GGDEF)-like protein
MSGPRPVAARSAAHWLERAAIALIVSVSVLVPVVFLLIQIQYERGVLSSIASMRAFLVSQHVSRNPQMWRFEEHRLIEYVSNGMLGHGADDHCRILSVDGETLIENVEAATLAAPTLSVRAAVFDAGRIVGEVVVERSVRPLWLRFAAIALGSLLMGSLLIALLRYLPLQALRRAEADLRYRAEHDALTGLPNREHFRHLLRLAVDEAGARRTPVAVLFIDLDRFKAVNDNFGHDAGDAVLGEIARRLVGCCPACGVAARLSGDEFALMVPGVSADAAMGVAGAVVTACARPVVVGMQVHQLGCSVGVACFPVDADRFDDLLTQADTAMLHAKREGRCRAHRYDAAMRQVPGDRVRVDPALPPATPMPASPVATPVESADSLAA